MISGLASALLIILGIVASLATVSQIAIWAGLAVLLCGVAVALISPRVWPHGRWRIARLSGAALLAAFAVLVPFQMEGVHVQTLLSHAASRR